MTFFYSSTLNLVSKAVKIDILVNKNTKAKKNDKKTIMAEFNVLIEDLKTMENVYKL